MSCNSHDEEHFTVELNLRKQKLQTTSNYTPHKTLILEYISTKIDSHSSRYNSFRVIGDCNSDPTEKAMKIFYQMRNLKYMLQNMPYAT